MSPCIADFLALRCDFAPRRTIALYELRAACAGWLSVHGGAFPELRSMEDELADHAVRIAMREGAPVAVGVGLRASHKQMETAALIRRMAINPTKDTP
ncbi:hypothetical protein ACIQZN_15565 [Streptomyces sp. NPDC097595]|uniref:hypothetical protein n=1 Tax=Streptomyces sp. NPDC097595 TaxID=3366090 RepID=UPI0037F2B355